MAYLLGIDVGTTRTAAAINRSEAPDSPEMMTLGDHSVDIPSVVFLSDDGTLVFGEAAERRGVGEPDRVAREFKRRLGDPTPVSIGGQAFTPETLSALLVRHVVDIAARREGSWPERIAVTHPASWGAHKTELFGEALADAGLTVTFLAEPQAAALCLAGAERVEPGSTIAVYDLGGGTFDAAVVRKDGTHEAGGFTLLGRPEGVEFLGGVDFDQVVFDHVRATLPDAFAGLDEADPQTWAAVARLRRDCCEAKEALSADTEVSIPVWLGAEASGNGYVGVRLHRSEFEDLIRGPLEETVHVLRRAVASAGLDPAVLSSVLLVGGSSRIPLVAQLVSEQLERPVSVDADPKNAIAKGAALALAEPAGPALSPPPGPAPSGSGPGGPGPAVPGPPPWAAPAAMAGAEASAGPGPTGDRMAAGFQGEPSTEYIDPSMAGTEYVPAGYGPQEPPTQEIPVVGAYGGYEPEYPPGYGPTDGYDGETALAPEPVGRAGRSPALLIGAGGVVAAVAVIGAVLFWPSDKTVSNATPELPALPTTSASAPPAPTTEQSPRTTDQPERTRERSTAPRPTEDDPVVPTPVPPDPGVPPSTTSGPTSTPSTSSDTPTSTSSSSSPVQPQPRRR